MHSQQSLRTKEYSHQSLVGLRFPRHLPALSWAGVLFSVPVDPRAELLPSSTTSLGMEGTGIDQEKYHHLACEN